MPEDLLIEIQGFPDYYINQSGEIFSYKWGNWKRIKECTHRQGYKNVRLTVKGVERVRYVHRLLYEAFGKNWNQDLFINHKNGIKDDNRLENLEMVTNQENVQHAVAMGLLKPSTGYDSHRSKLNKAQISNIRGTTISAKVLALEYDVCVETIRRVRRGEVYNG